MGSRQASAADAHRSGMYLVNIIVKLAVESGSAAKCNQMIPSAVQLVQQLGIRVANEAAIEVVAVGFHLQSSLVASVVVCFWCSSTGSIIDEVAAYSSNSGDGCRGAS